MDNVTKQSSFSRSMTNDAKLGAYYTDNKICGMIGKYLEFPETGHVNVLEPSIGDGSALFSVLSSAANAGVEKLTYEEKVETVKNNLNISTYAVELNPQSYEELNNRGVIDYLVKEDFLTGTCINNKGFSFCFSNPPYGMNPIKKERLEISFLQKISATLKAGGIIAYVIPEYVITENTRFQKEWVSRFVTAGIHRFPAKVYKDFQQCVMFGVRKHLIHTYEEEFATFNEMVANMEEISPDYQGEKIRIPSSEEKEVKYFTTYMEDPKKNIRSLQGSPAFNAVRLTEKPYTNTKIGNPIVPLKKDLIYLLAVSGCGQGLAGSKENRDLHLQRGNVKRIETTRYEPSKYGVDEIVTETSAVCMTIIENDGTITRFDS